MSFRDEEACQDALRRYEILDTESEHLFDNIVKLASQICHTKIAVLTLLDEQRQWFKARVGLDVSFTSRDISFCTHAVMENEVMIIQDAYEDMRFKNSPLVTGSPFIRFYAGAVLRTMDGHAIGTIAVIDDKPRTIDVNQIEALKGFAGMIMAQLELRKRTKELAEEKLKLKQSLEVINAVPDFIGTCDLQGTILSFNKAFGDVSKISEVDQIFDYYPQWVKTMMHKIAIPHAMSHGIWRGESAVLTKDKKEFQIFQTVICHMDEAGRPLFFSTIMQDISMLKTTNSRIETLTQHAPVGIFMTDAVGKIEFFNRYWLEMAGMTLGEALADNGVASYRAIYPDDYSYVFNSWQETISNPSETIMDYRIQNQTNLKTHYVNTKINQIRNTKNEVIGHIGICLDVTEQRLNHDKLIASYNQLGKFIENVPAAVAMFDSEIRYVAASKSWITDYGLSERGFDELNIIGKSHYEVFPGISDEWKHIHQEALNGKLQQKQDDNFLREDGSLEWLNWDVRPWHNEENAIGGIMMLTEVTTEKKRVERELQLARAEAEKAYLVKSAFIANMSHEIRTPLNSIIGLSEILSHQITEPEQFMQIKTVQKSGEVLLSLINDILDISVSDTGNVSLQNSEINVEELVNKITQIFSFEARSKDINLTYEIEKGLGHFIGDPVRITQVLLKLLSNAIKYSPRGNVKILIKKNNLNHKGTILFSITDDGIGIREDKQSLIFERFNKLQSLKAKALGSTGLGLAFAKDLVELMGGSIWVKSEFGNGSEFSFTLDLPSSVNVSKAVIDVVENKDELDIFSQKLRILLVDDSEDNQKLILAYLKKYPFEVITAENGQQALAFLKESKFDLVFMDIQMPMMDGLTATKQYRQWEKAHAKAHLPIIALTAFSLAEDKLMSLEAGCDLHLTKPVKKNTILEAIKEIILKPSLSI
jgi:PAS domain S-box-containing protein